MTALKKGSSSRILRKLKRLGSLMLLVLLGCSTNAQDSTRVVVVKVDTFLLTPLSRGRSAVVQILEKDSFRNVVNFQENEICWLNHIVQNDSIIQENMAQENELLTEIVKTETDKSNIYKSESEQNQGVVEKQKKIIKFGGGIGAVLIILALLL